ncbi:MAG: helix-turn-helix domain-containing protein [Terriglobales bacterium]
MTNNSGLAPRLLNVRDAAAYLGTTVWFIRNLGWSDSLPVLKLGNRWLFDKADLDAYVDRMKTQSA